MYVAFCRTSLSLIDTHGEGETIVRGRKVMRSLPLIHHRQVNVKPEKKSLSKLIDLTSLLRGPIYKTPTLVSLYPCILVSFSDANIRPKMYTQYTV
jgi:hypothetical protein